MFDQEVIKKYIDGNAVECPYCKIDSENYSPTGEFDTINDGHGRMNMECKDCGRRWIEVWQLITIEERT